MGRPVTTRLDLGGREVLGDLGPHAGEVLLAGRGALGDEAHDLVVDLRVERREGEVLELPLDGVHAEAVREGRVDLERLVGLALGRLGADVAPGARVVQPVGELDDEDPDVAGHRDDHLAHGLGLRGLAVGDLVELGDAVDEHRDLVAEVAPQLVEAVCRVLDGVVQQRRRERRRRHAELGEDRRHGERVRDVRVAALAHLALVRMLGDGIRPLDDRQVGLRVVLADGRHEGLEDGVTGRPGGPEASETGAHPRRGGQLVADVLAHEVSLGRPSGITA